MHSIKSFFLFTLCAAGFVLAGCNSFSSFEDEPRSADALYSEATIALQQGNVEEAEDGFRDAIESDPSYDAARVKLATTLLQKQGIDVIDFLSISRAFNGEETSQAARNELAQVASLQAGAEPAANLMGGGTCSFPIDHESEHFDPKDNPRFELLSKSPSELQEVQELVREVMGGVDPAQFAEEAPARDGLTEELVAEALLDAAIAYASRGYVNVSESGGESFTFYRVTPPGGGETYTGYCAPDEPTLNAVMAQVSCLLGDFEYTNELVSARASLLGSTQAQELAENADRAYQTLAREIEFVCERGSEASAEATRQVS